MEQAQAAAPVEQVPQEPETTGSLQEQVSSLCCIGVQAVQIFARLVRNPSWLTRCTSPVTQLTEFQRSVADGISSTLHTVQSGVETAGSRLRGARSDKPEVGIFG